MKPTATAISMALILLPSLWLIQPQAACAQDSGPSSFRSQGAYIKITKNFYDALRNEAKSQDRVYGEGGGGDSDEYLRRIEISTRFMVETNLRIMAQQEKMIHLLETLVRKNKKRP